MFARLRLLARNKQFKEGAPIRSQDFVLPFKQNMNLLTAMFEIRKWFIFNTPHKYYAQKYTNEMAHLHNQLNYQHARLLMRNGVLVFSALYIYFWFFMQADAVDWKDTFDLKFNQKAYGSLVGSAGQGNSSIDQ